MPVRRYKKGRKSPAKRAYQKRRRQYKRRGGRTTLRGKGPTGLPDRMMVKMKYTTQIDLADAGAGGLYIFRGNSIYDPDYSGIGGQATSHDQWANFYNYYRVRASKIRINCVSLSNLANTSAMIAIFPEIAVPAVGISPLTIVDQPYARYKIVGQGDGGNNALVLSNYMSTQKLFGRAIIDDNFQAPMSANPADPWHWGVRAINMVNLGTGTYRMIVQLTYYVEMFERETLPAS